MRGKEGYALRESKGGIAIIGRDYGRNEEREGQPFVGRAGRLLDDCLGEAGIRRSDAHVLNVVNKKPPANKFEAHRRADVEAGLQLLRSTLEEIEPDLIVTLGNEASHALIEEWPGETIFGASGIEERRGYVWDTEFGPTLSTVHPAFANRSWKPFRTLLSFDLQRAKETLEEIDRDGHLRRPRREVEIVTGSSSARSALDALRSHDVIAGDIETYEGGELACVGFAGQSGKAYVFPAVRSSGARELLEDPDVSIIWANGIYDLTVLKHFEGWDVRAEPHDVQLLWHSLYPELAGKAEGSNRQKMTRKSLAFLASLVTLDPWWKGVYETEEEFFVYNGKDCCITLDIFEHFHPRAKEAGALPVYDHERSLMMPCVDMLARGLRVDDGLRQERLTLLAERYEVLDEDLNALAIPLIQRERERIDDIHLFEQIDPTCPCCRHGAKKQSRCWECAGLESGYLKKDLQRLAIRAGLSPNGRTKAELEEELLDVCQVCGGEEREEYLRYNGNSDAQQKILLYDVLRLPKRTKGGKLTTEERALKDLAGVVS